MPSVQTNGVEDSQPLPPIRILKDEICNAQSGSQLYQVTRLAGPLPSFMSSKCLLVVTRVDDETRMGSIQFHATTENIDLSMNGWTTKILHKGFWESRWEFQTTASSASGEKWHWRKDELSHSIVLEDAKKNGQLLARIRGNCLTFEKDRLSGTSYEEVLLSAIALAEAARREHKNANIQDLGGSIGTYGSGGGDGGGGGGGDGGGGGGS